MARTRALIAEMQQEGDTTRKVLERVPEDRFSWTPHARSRTLGQLAYHVAGIPSGIARLLTPLESPPPDVPEVAPASREQLLQVHADSLRAAVEALEGWGEEGLTAMWKMVSDGNVLLELPRHVMVRMLMMNHLYHHRGQLSVYLRLLDVAVPPIYGPSADESPFG